LAKAFRVGVNITQQPDEQPRTAGLPKPYKPEPTTPGPTNEENNAPFRKDGVTPITRFQRDQPLRHGPLKPIPHTPSPNQEGWNNDFNKK
jgi:hypothetical protein